MAGFTHVQVLDTPLGHKVTSWPMDVEEQFCEESFAVIVAGTDRCAQHADEPETCPIGLRTPPECRHGSPDFVTDPEHPRCTTCGLVGEDVSDQIAPGPPPVAGPDEMPEAT